MSIPRGADTQNNNAGHLRAALPSR